MSVCPTCGQRKRRSLPQNARLHAIFMRVSENVRSKDNEFHSPMWWKTMMKAQWLGFMEFRKPDGQVIQVLKSTADLDVAELNDFMTQVEAFAAQKGIYLDD